MPRLTAYGPTGLGVAALLAAPTVQAHAPEARWGIDPWVAVPLVVLMAVYLRGWLGSPRRRGGGGRVAAFWLGCATLAVALLGPMEAWAEEGLAAHMIQHMLLIGVAAPLLVLAWPGPVLLRGLPNPWRRAVVYGAVALRGPWSWATRLAVASLLHAAVIWLWHAPPAFDAALSNRALHTLEHLSFVLSAVLFWWAVRVATVRGEAGAAGLWILFTMIHMGLLGALLTFAPAPLYGYHEPLPFGFTALEDQQLAGLVMWVPAGAVYLGAGLAVLGYWLTRAGRNCEPARPSGRAKRA
ncbi:cytochrome c oxidase assembly protein [Ectothiorhodospiraceae bacterium 2226]|nr:cytochrome c oxidase assembly protein [Ectothiorhodospiraceae bacterium 2226]